MEFPSAHNNTSGMEFSKGSKQGSADKMPYSDVKNQALLAIRAHVHKVLPLAGTTGDSVVRRMGRVNFG